MVYDEQTNAEWRIQFLWPFKSAYLILSLDPNYEKTLVGVPNRNHLWIMSRKAHMTEAEYQRMLDDAKSLGYDANEVRRVPQRWPAE